MDDGISSTATSQSDVVELATTVIAAYVSNNSVPASELPALIAGVHAAITELRSPSASAEPKGERTTPGQIRKSITHEALVSFEDGKPYKTLKRHLTKLGLTPEDYRAKWGLPHDYPMTAASYSETRSALAKSLGLGARRRRAAPKLVEVAETIIEAPGAQGRGTAAEAPAASLGKPARTRKPRTAAAE